jgi:hypothetical protein
MIARLKSHRRLEQRLSDRSAVVWKSGRLLIAAASLVVMSASSASGAGSRDGLVLRHLEKNTIENAVGIYLTPKGERYFAENLERVLDNTGFSIREAYFPVLNWRAEAPISLEHMATGNPELQATMTQIRQLLSEWFRGLNVQDPQPEVTVRGAGYRLKFSKLALVADRQLQGILRRQGGAVLALEAEIHELEAGAEVVAIRDPQRNPYLGTLGAKEPNLKMRRNSPPVKLRLPFYVNVAANRSLQVESLPMFSTFASADFDLRYADLLAPRITLQIDEQLFEMSRETLIRNFEQHKTKIVDQLKIMLDKIVKTSLPESINEKLTQLVPQHLEQVSPLSPPGKDECSSDADFLWGLMLRRVSLTPDVLALELAAYIEDPSRRSPRPEASAMARGAANLAGTDPKTYDLAMTINRGLINRILQLSHGRGYFDRLDLGDGETIKLWKAPTVDLDPSAGNSPREFAQLRASIGVESEVSGFMESLATSGPVRVTFDIYGRIYPNPTGGKGLRVRADRIDVASVRVERSSLSWIGAIFSGSVESAARKKVQAAAAQLAAKPAEIPADIDLPPEFFGQRLQPKGLRVDRNGHLTMLLDFGPITYNSVRPLSAAVGNQEEARRLAALARRCASR